MVHKFAKQKPRWIGLSLGNFCVDPSNGKRHALLENYQMNLEVNATLPLHSIQAVKLSTFSFGVQFTDCIHLHVFSYPSMCIAGSNLVYIFQPRCIVYLKQWHLPVTKTILFLRMVAHYYMVQGSSIIVIDVN